MSTAAENVTVIRAERRDRAVFWRFVWKELRMLRGLWLAVGIMGLVALCVEKLFLPPSSDYAAIFFATALASAVLYAVGAAATTFSVEHEEETYDFLARLPTRWWPVFAGKLFTTTATSLLLAAALALVGWGTWNRSFGSEPEIAVGMLGIAIFEALAWGTFFSLIIRRPLVAAIVTMLVGALVVNVAVNSQSTYAVASSNPRAYVSIIPFRLSVVAMVLACSALMARRWLVRRTRPVVESGVSHEPGFKAGASRVKSWLGKIGFAANRGARRRMLARLLWQTWRESGKFLLLPIGVAIVLFFVMSLIGWASGSDGVTAATPLFVPTLYGAMAFYVDQRRGSYRFLAEHAARPRYVWLARHLVWLGAFVACWFVLICIGTTIIGSGLSGAARNSLDYYMRWGTLDMSTTDQYLYEQARISGDAFRVLSVASFAALVAYAVGQLFSMVLRSEILAGFVALVLSFIVSAWGGVLFVWQLSSWMFALPLFLGFMLATWFRTPDWLAGRNSVRAWLKPAISIVAAIVWIGFWLPSTRLAQLPTLAPDVERNRNLPVAEVIHDELSTFRAGITPEARKTAEIYLKAAERGLKASEYPLERWEKEPYLDLELGRIDVKKIPADQLEAYHNAVIKWNKLVRDHFAATSERAIEASKRPTCYFDFQLHDIGVSQNRDWYLARAYPLYRQLDELLTGVCGASIVPVEPGEVFNRLLAGLRMSAHIRSGQPSVVFIAQLEREQVILKWIGDWALNEKRTKVELQSALEQLNDFFRPGLSLKEPLLADHLLVEDAIAGRHTPLVLMQSPIPMVDFLAYLANQVPWERERARMALNRITLRNVRNDRKLVQQVTSAGLNAWNVSIVRHWVRPLYNGMPESWVIQEPQAATSYLAALEYTKRNSASALGRAYCDNEVYRRATLIQIALAMYRIDHDKYPPRLTDLAPTYLTKLPLDPYMNQPFAYLPAGLDRDLKTDEFDVDRGAHVKWIQANTPFFWSEGAGGASLRLVPSRQYQRGDTENAGESQRTSTIFVFVNSDIQWWGRALVFPLPK